MSLLARQQLVNSGRLIFQNPDQQAQDLLDPTVTQTELIAMLVYLTREFYIEVTAVKTDHRNDAGLNPTPPYIGTHAGGWAVDGWPLNSKTAGDWMDQNSEAFRDFLGAVAQGPFYFQTGLAGSAFTDANMVAAGKAAFHDDGGDHVHIGTQ